MFFHFNQVCFQLRCLDAFPNFVLNASSGFRIEVILKKVMKAAFSLIFYI